MSGANDKATQDIQQKLVEAGQIDESELPFDESENKAPETDEEETVEIPYTLKLEHPFKLGNREVTELVFKNRLTAGMMKHLPLTDESQIKRGHYHPILEKMTGEPSKVIEELSPIDWMLAVGVVTHFLA